MLGHSVVLQPSYCSIEYFVVFVYEMTEQEMNVTCKIACNPSEIELLNSVYQLLKDGNVLGTLQSSNVVDFKHPEELKVTNSNSM